MLNRKTMENDDVSIPLIVLVVVFYVVGFIIALYIRVSKILLIKKIKATGRVISISETLISMLMQLQSHSNRPQVSPVTGLPAPPPYTIETPPPPPPVLPNEQPPPYVEPPPYSK